MKKLLVILWTVIFGGAIFIGFNLGNEPATENPDQGFVSTTSDEEKQTYSEYVVAGDKAFKEKDYAAAAENYAVAAKINPNSSQILNKLGNAYLLNKEAEKGKEAFMRSQKLNPQSVTATLGIVRSALAIEDSTKFNQNIEDAKNALFQIESENNDIKYYKAIVYVLYKDFANAKKLFAELNDEKSQKFLKKFETFESYKEGEQIFLQTLLAKALTEVGEDHAAIPLLFDVIKQKNNYRDAWIVLGYAFLNNGAIKDSIDAFSQAKDLDPKKPETLFFLGIAYSFDNNLDKAILYVEEADKNGFEPKEEIKLKLGDLYMQKENYEKAAQSYEALVSQNTSNLDVFVRLIWLKIEKLNEPQKAVTLANIALENHPNKAMAYNLKGWALTATGEYDEAKNYLAQALKLDKKLNAIYLNLGWLYERQESLELAKEYYKKAYILTPDNSVGQLAQNRLKNLSVEEQNKFYQVNITSP